MASVFPVNRTPVTTTYNSRSGGTHLTRAMSRHAAAAVMVFALLQIALVLAAREAGASPALLYVALAVLVLGAIPSARAFERRWARFGGSALPCPGLVRRFRRDCARLWLAALLVAPAWVGIAVLLG